MNEMETKRHNFDLAKNRINELYEKQDAELKIENVSSDGGFLWLFNHKVTGDEFNKSLETIQNHFITVNKTNTEVIKELREVYNALNVLDDGYITSIVANVKAIEKTSNDVRRQQETLQWHNEQLVDQQRKLEAHQVEIERNVENISKIVTALKAFKEKIESNQSLTDIDSRWKDVEKYTFKLLESEKRNKELTETVQTMNVAVESLKKKVECAYWIAAGSAGLAIIELILFLVKVM